MSDTSEQVAKEYNAKQEAWASKTLFKSLSRSYVQNNAHTQKAERTLRGANKKKESTARKPVIAVKKIARPAPKAVEVKK